MKITLNGGNYGGREISTQRKTVECVVVEAPDGSLWGYDLTRHADSLTADFVGMQTKDSPMCVASTTLKVAGE